MTILLCDRNVRNVTVTECGEPLERLGPDISATGALARVGIAERLSAAAAMLPGGIRLNVVEGFRTAQRQQAIINSYAARICALHPGIGPDDLERLTSRFVSPIEVAPHVAGAAVDLTLVDDDGHELDLGTPIDATPEMSEGRCYFSAPNLTRVARENRTLLAEALEAQGFINYPTEWWHWSFGDRYWALMTGAPDSIYGPVSPLVTA